MPTQDPWETTTGLLESFDFEIKDGWFGFDDEYNDGKSLLFKARGIATIDGEIEDDEHVIRFTCGDGWEDTKGGEEARHRAGATQFNARSGMGYLINRFKELGLVDVLRDRGTPTQAKTFAGLKLHMEREAVNVFTPKGQTEPVTQYVTLPTAILDDIAAPAKASKAKASTKRSSRAKASDDDEEEEAPAPKAKRGRKPKVRDLREEVIEFASEFEDHGEFVNAVFDPEEFERAEEAEGDEELAEEILDPDGELWEESQA